MFDHDAPTTRTLSRYEPRLLELLHEVRSLKDTDGPFCAASYGNGLMNRVNLLDNLSATIEHARSVLAVHGQDDPFVADTRALLGVMTTYAQLLDSLNW